MEKRTTDPEEDSTEDFDYTKDKFQDENSTGKSKNGFFVVSKTKTNKVIINNN